MYLGGGERNHHVYDYDVCRREEREITMYMIMMYLREERNYHVYYNILRRRERLPYVRGTYLTS